MIGYSPENPAVTAEQLQALHEYGPLLVTTRNSDILGICEDFRHSEGVRIVTPLPGDKDQRQRVIFSSAALVVEDGEQISLGFGLDGMKDIVPIPLEDIEYAHPDHPFGHNMPLNGQNMMSLAIYDRGGMYVPRWVNRAVEYGYNDVVESGLHPNQEGVGVVQTYNVSSLPYDANPTIEEAKALGGHSMRFLISHGRRSGEGPPYHIVTSRMGYDPDRRLTVRPPNYPNGLPLKHVEMLDVGRDTPDDELLTRHLERMEDLNYAYREGRVLPIGQMAVDEVFLYMAHD